MIIKLIAAIICAIIFTTYFTLHGSKEYFLSYFTFSSLIYFLIGVPISYFVDFLISKNLVNLDSKIHFLGSLLFYAIAGLIIISLLLISLKSGINLFSSMIFGSIAASSFFIIQYIMNKLFTSKL